MKTVREILIEEYYKGERTPSDLDLAGLLMFEIEEIVRTGVSDKHRWFSMVPTVAKCGKYFISYDAVVADGDSCWSDCCDEKTILDNACVVERHTRTIEEVYYK